MTSTSWRRSKTLIIGQDLTIQLVARLGINTEMRTAVSRSPVVDQPIVYGAHQDGSYLLDDLFIDTRYEPQPSPDHSGRPKNEIYFSGLEEAQTDEQAREQGQQNRLGGPIE